MLLDSEVDYTAHLSTRSTRWMGKSTLDLKRVNQGVAPH
jgi:hypothetical protein